MSLIRLRAQMRRRRRHAASLAVLLALGGVVAAHHGGLTGGHQSGHGGAPMSADHGTHKPATPAVEADIALAGCLAVLPLLALIGLAALGAPVPRWGLLIVRAPGAPVLASGPSPARRSRAGPRLLCVMRC